MALLLLKKHSHKIQKRKGGEERLNSKRGMKILPSSASPVEWTSIQESAFPATTGDASSAQFHSLTLKTDGCHYAHVRIWLIL